MSLEQFLGVTSILGPIITFLVTRRFYVYDSRRSVDKELFDKFNEIFPHQTYKNFLDDTWNMQYTAGYLNTPIREYLELIKTPLNHYNNKKLQILHIRFAESLEKLFYFVSTEFSFSGEQFHIMNLKSTAPYESERCDRVSKEVERLNNEMDKFYNDYIKELKKRLSI